MTPFRAIHAGFTLIEVLVALVITSLIMTLLMGANFYVMQARVKLIEEVRVGELHAREQLWFKQIVSTILPVTEDTPGAFDGNETQFSSWQTQPLSADPIATPQVATLSLQENKEISGYDLVYNTDRNKMLLATWSNATANFSYLDSRGKIFTQWNPRLRPDEHIPQAIQIEVKSVSDGTALDFWFAKTNATPWLMKKITPSFLVPGSS